MDTRPVLFMDSGIGGIPYCRHFHQRNPGERVVYLADRLRFPYGKRERPELVAILTGLVEKLISAVNPKIAVLACNTATVSALDSLRGRFPQLPFVGTVPAVKPAALASKTGKVGVLGTERAIKEPYIRRLAAENGNVEVCGIGAPKLVELVEHRLFIASENEKRAAVREYLDRFRAAGVDAIVLGCTHFLFLQEEFRREAAPDIAVFDSVDGISRRAESLLDDHGGKLRSGSFAAAGGVSENLLLIFMKKFRRETAPGIAVFDSVDNISRRAESLLDDHGGKLRSGSFAAAGGVSENLLLITGPQAPEPAWRQWADELGFRIGLLEES